MTRENTPAELTSSQFEIKEEPGDTPLAAGARGTERVVWGFAATTQIMNPSYLALNDYVLISRDMTGASEEEVLRGTEMLSEEAARELPSQPMGDAEIANRDRLELLARSYVAGKLSAEEDARLAIVTERVRRLIPRVTVDDFERLREMAEDVRRIEAEDHDRRRRLGLL
jgi:hypothetical protein